MQKKINEKLNIQKCKSISKTIIKILYYTVEDLKTKHKIKFHDLEISGIFNSFWLISD